MSESKIFISITSGVVGGLVGFILSLIKPFYDDFIHSKKLKKVLSNEIDLVFEDVSNKYSFLETNLKEDLGILSCVPTRIFSPIFDSMAEDFLLLYIDNPDKSRAIRNIIAQIEEYNGHVDGCYSGEGANKIDSFTACAQMLHKISCNIRKYKNPYYKVGDADKKRLSDLMFYLIKLKKTIQSKR